MKLEEVLPALREGKKIRRKCWWNKKYIVLEENADIITNSGQRYVFTTNTLLADDWEIVKEKKKVKLRDLTEEQFDKWILKNCQKNKECKNCVFNRVNCINTSAYCWIKNKSLFNDTFLDQEIEIEDE